jgi:Zn finger protein HypA/HybF involved in hydrogenase expression
MTETDQHAWLYCHICGTSHYFTLSQTRLMWVCPNCNSEEAQND